MELPVAIISALIGLSAAFFLSLSFYDMLPEGWRERRPGRSRSLQSIASVRPSLKPRTIRQTHVD
jgi:hypothetical protein